MKSLVWLSLEASCVSDVSFVRELPNLRFLGLASCEISDVSPLVGLRDRGCQVELANNQLEARLDELESKAD